MKDRIFLSSKFRDDKEAELRYLGREGMESHKRRKVRRISEEKGVKNEEWEICWVRCFLKVVIFLKIMI